MDINLLTKLVEEGKSARNIATITGRSPSGVKYWLNKFELKTCFRRRRKDEYKCFHCSETDPSKFYGKRKKSCGKCHNKDVAKRGQEKRQFAVDYLGGKCQNCQYNQYICSLDIHHLDPSQKDINFKSMRGWSTTRIIKELQTCILLCKNCHTAVHNNNIQLNI